MDKSHSTHYICIYIYIIVIFYLSRKSDLFVVVAQSLSCMQLFVTPWTAAYQLFCPPLSPGVCSNYCPLSRLIKQAINLCLSFAYINPRLLVGSFLLL